MEMEKLNPGVFSALRKNPKIKRSISLESFKRNKTTNKDGNEYNTLSSIDPKTLKKIDEGVSVGAEIMSTIHEDLASFYPQLKNKKTFLELTVDEVEKLDINSDGNIKKINIDREGLVYELGNVSDQKFLSIIQTTSDTHQYRCEIDPSLIITEDEEALIEDFDKALQFGPFFYNSESRRHSSFKDALSNKKLNDDLSSTIGKIEERGIKIFYSLYDEYIIEKSDTNYDMIEVGSTWGEGGHDMWKYLTIPGYQAKFFTQKKSILIYLTRHDLSKCSVIIDNQLNCDLNSLKRPVLVESGPEISIGGRYSNEAVKLFFEKHEIWYDQFNFYFRPKGVVPDIPNHWKASNIFEFHISAEGNSISADEVKITSSFDEDIPF